MIRSIVKDTFLLSRKAVETTPQDTGIFQDLKDTLQAHSTECVGMAANMIGCCKRVIIVGILGKGQIFANPRIVEKKGAYITEEGCLSFPGSLKKTERYRTIVLQYEDEDFRSHRQVFTGYVAQIIQHEMDHLDGICI